MAQNNNNKLQLAPGGLTGNGVIGIRREDKNVWERRCPLTPNQVSLLLSRGIVKKVIVQPSTIRCYNDDMFAAAGAELNEDLSGASTICAVKEVPPELLIPERSYLFFTHTIKAQPYNMPLLDTLLKKNIRIIDYERIAGKDGRLVKFGPYAGYAGMIDTLHGLGKALLLKGFSTPFLTVSQSREYRSLDTARRDLILLGQDIRTHGIPREVGPLIIAVCGNGAVSGAAQEILHHLPCKYVMVDELASLWKNKTFDNKKVYVLVVAERDMVARKDSSKPFSKMEYFKNPERYFSTFARDIAPYCQVMVNAIYWEEKYPRLLTNEQARALHREGRFPLLVLGDITCDIGGAVEMLAKSTSIQNPFFVYRVEQNDTLPEEGYTGEGVRILGVDHLPAEFACESSTDFGTGLVPLVEKVAVSDGLAPLSEQHKQLGPEIFNGMVANQGKLTPHFEYIAKLRAENEAKARNAPPRPKEKNLDEVSELKAEISRLRKLSKL